MKHGTTSTYTNRGCRCDACTRAQADYQWAADKRRQRALKAGAVTPEHGKLSTYTNYRCRCDACRAAKAVAWAEWSARRKASA